MADFQLDPNADPPTRNLKTPLRKNGSDENKPIRILLADEPSVFRDGLRAVLSAQSDFQVVAEAPDAASVLALAASTRPDIILLDSAGADGVLAALNDLRQSQSKARVILLTSSEDAELLSHAVRHGVAGMLPRRSPTELLFKSIRKVSAGELWLDRNTTAEVVRQLTGRPIPAPRNVALSDKPVALSRREREIVGLVAQGFRNREIADKLFISEQTVKNHLHNIFDKIGVQDRLELALYAIFYRIYQP